MKESVLKKKFQILDHLADLKIKVWGKNLNELINHTLEAIQTALKPEITNKEIKTEIKISAEKLDDLFLNFLEELIYQMDINDAIYSKLEGKKITEKEMRAKLWGKKIKRFELEIKGITRHDFEVKKDGHGYTATLLFDV